MKKSLMTVSIAFACVCATIFFLGCNKLFDGGGHYTLSGTLIDSCGGQRVPNRPLVVIYSDMTYPHPITNKVIGRGQADASGFFRIKCEHVNSGNITLIDTLSGYKYFQIACPPSSDSAYSLGLVYTDHGIYRATVKIEIHGTFLPIDTVYFGRPNGAYKCYYPVISGSTYLESYQYDAAEGIQKKALREYVWSIGKARYSKGNSVAVAFNICDYSDTTTSVTINRP